MPLTAVVWNIEQFGARLGTFTKGKTVEELRCQLVVQLMTEVSADVLVIQELRRDGVMYLRRLKALLGGSWHFDWLPGAQATSGDLTDFDQLAFMPTANNEGYGVLWRTGKLAPLVGSLMSAGMDTVDTTTASKKRPHYIDLSTEGKKLKFDEPTTTPIGFDEDSALESVAFPHSTCPQVVDNTLETRGNSYSSNDAAQQEIGSRRPCRVEMNVSSSRTVPLVVYHAPVGARSSRSPLYGTLIGCSVDALQFDDPSEADCVYAGDFNVVSDRDQALLTTYMPNIGYDKFNFNQSMVHVFKFGGGFRTGTGVFGSARDIAFVKAPTGLAPATSITDVLWNDIIEKTGSMRNLFFTNAKTLQGKVFPALVAEQKADWNQDVMDVANAYLAGNTGNNFPHGADQYTAAAIMYTTFLSDHLPVVITYK
ncbi:MAG TPA: endonuclease/exonuclease/phosphatase family protein [Methylomirabilota bacterium]|nr:endonuclease/exonuclease/phosphatase family protein [Methylomirabilota bacterium]